MSAIKHVPLSIIHQLTTQREVPGYRPTGQPPRTVRRLDRGQSTVEYALLVWALPPSLLVLGMGEPRPMWLGHCLTVCFVGHGKGGVIGPSRRCRGQSTVELAAVLPVLVILTLLVIQGGVGVPGPNRPDPPLSPQRAAM